MSSIGWTTRASADESALQEHALLSAAPFLVTKLPSNISYDEAATLPTSLNTASVALYHPDGFGIPSPWEGNRNFGNGKAALVTGGSSVVGLGGTISRCIATNNKHSNSCDCLDSPRLLRQRPVNTKLLLKNTEPQI